MHHQPSSIVINRHFPKEGGRKQKIQIFHSQDSLAMKRGNDITALAVKKVSFDCFFLTREQRRRGHRNWNTCFFLLTPSSVVGSSMHFCSTDQRLHCIHSLFEIDDNSSHPTVLINSKSFRQPKLSKRRISKTTIIISIMGGPSINDKFPNLVGSTQDSDNFDLYEYLGDSWGVIFMVRTFDGSIDCRKIWHFHFQNLTDFVPLISPAPRRLHSSLQYRTWRSNATQRRLWQERCQAMWIFLQRRRIAQGSE